MTDTDTQTQNPSRPVDPLAQLVVDELLKSGTRAWLGVPPPEEMERFRTEKAEHDFEALKRREEAKDRRLAELKQAAIRNFGGTNER